VAVTKKILFVQDLPHGWTLYGKTGMGSLLNADGTKNPDLSHGWFVGWIEKEGRIIVFANHLDDETKEDIPASLRAKQDAKDRMMAIIEHIENGS
jgi:beta-lactamase class D